LRQARARTLGGTAATNPLAPAKSRRAGFDSIRVSDVYYTALLRFAGCAATSHEIAAVLGGDDIVVRARGDLIDATRPAEALRFVAGLGHGVDRLRILGRLPGMSAIVAARARADCEVGAGLCTRLGLPGTVVPAVLDGFERFDGNGGPDRKAGSDIAEAARFGAVGFAAVMFEAVGGEQAAADTVARWSGQALDPAIPQTFMADGHGRVVALMRVSGSRPDGRTFDDPQVLVFDLDGDRVRSVDQYIGDPTAVTAFWA
jgi:hypothetical protein